MPKLSDLMLYLYLFLCNMTQFINKLKFIEANIKWEVAGTSAREYVLLIDVSARGCHMLLFDRYYITTENTKSFDLLGTLNYFQLMRNGIRSTRQNYVPFSFNSFSIKLVVVIN